LPPSNSSEPAGASAKRTATQDRHVLTLSAYRWRISMRFDALQGWSK
jgi:hypothetical protein